MRGSTVPGAPAEASTQTPTHNDHWRDTVSASKAAVPATRHTSPRARESRLGRRQIEGGEQREGRPGRALEFAGRIAGRGDGRQHVDLVLGLVPPHPSDDRGVRQAHSRVRLHTGEHPLEGEVGDARTESLVVEDPTAGRHHEGAQLVLAATLPAPAGGLLHASMLPDAGPGTPSARTGSGRPGQHVLQSGVAICYREVQTDGTWVADSPPGSWRTPGTVGRRTSGRAPDVRTPIPSAAGPGGRRTGDGAVGDRSGGPDGRGIPSTTDGPTGRYRGHGVPRHGRPDHPPPATHPRRRRPVAGPGHGTAGHGVHLGNGRTPTHRLLLTRTGGRPPPAPAAGGPGHRAPGTDRRPLGTAGGRLSSVGLTVDFRCGVPSQGPTPPSTRGRPMQQFEPFEGVIGRTEAESEPWWPTPPHPGPAPPTWWSSSLTTPGSRTSAATARTWPRRTSTPWRRKASGTRTST